MFDPEDRVLGLYKEAKIAAVVVLNPIEEHLRHSGRELLPLYEKAGIEVIYDPAPDFSAPPQGTGTLRWLRLKGCSSRGKTLPSTVTPALGARGFSPPA